MLIAVDERLAEEPVAVADAVTVERDVLGSRALQIARRKPAQAPVAERRVLDLFKLLDVLADGGKRSADLIEDAEVHEVGVDGAPHQELCRKVAAAAAGRVLFIVPVGKDLLHHRAGDGVVKFELARGLDIAGIFRVQHALHAVKKCFLIKLHRVVDLYIEKILYFLTISYSTIAKSESQTLFARDRRLSDDEIFEIVNDNFLHFTK